MDCTTDKRMQDLPPKSGYAPFQTERVKLRTVLGFKGTIAAFLTSTLIGGVAYYHNYKLVRREQIEMRSARLAIMPLLLAEHDRAVLKQTRRNRDEEAELMKNIEQWEVGTYYGEPIFWLDKKDQYRNPLYAEHFAHTNPEILAERSARHLFT